MKGEKQKMRWHGIVTSSNVLQKPSTPKKQARLANLIAETLQSGHPSEILNVQEAASQNDGRKEQSAGFQKRKSASLRNARGATKRKRDNLEID
jgi:hypothetical protein